jgi:diguanylate cyclase (GGDEF)-like protein
LWTAIALAVAACRVTVAHVFLCQPERQAARKRTWFWLEWLGAVALACIWVASLAMLGSGQTDALFYVRMIFIVALVAFVLSSMGIDMRIYASFLAATVGGALLQLHLYFPAFLADMPVAHLAFVIYAVMLLVRSRGEQRRTREWVRARLTQRNLLDQLNQNIRQELLMHESLRIKSLELEGSNRRLAELATRDGLTGAFRRGHIEGELGRLVKGLQRRPGDLSVLLMDLDKFKQVNDIHGHAVGDEVLRRTAAKAQDVLRASDLFGRWGGEEFIVLLPDTALAQALETAERLREAIGRLEFTGEGGATLRITVSIGAAQYEPGESADELARRADKALYAAKHAGRNRVMAYEPGQSWFSELQ